MFPTPIEKTPRSWQLTYQSLLPLALIMWLLPLIAVAIFSIKPAEDFTQGNYWGLPSSFEMFNNYGQVFFNSDMPRYMLNSVLITVPTVVGAVALSCLAGFALGVYKFKSNIWIFFMFVAGNFVPFQILMVPVRDLTLDMGLYNTKTGLVLFHIAFQTGFCTLFMRNFIRALPHELIEAARAHPPAHMLLASTSSIYGANTEMPYRETDRADMQMSFYAATKKANELMAHTYSHLYRLPTTGLRFFTVYGPWGRPDMALFKFTKAIVAGEAIDVFNFGKHRRDFTYIDDIVEGVIRVLDHPAQANSKWDGDKPDPGTSKAPWRVYNIGNNQPIELMDYIGALEKALDKKAKMNLLPLQPGDIPDTYADVDDLVKQFDYKPATRVEKGVAHFVDWYRNYFNI